MAADPASFDLQAVQFTGAREPVLLQYASSTRSGPFATPQQASTTMTALRARMTLPTSDPFAAIVAASAAELQAQLATAGMSATIVTGLESAGA